MEDERREGLKLSVLDLSKRYDIYQAARSEERLYENVKLIGFKTLEDIPEEEPTTFGNRPRLPRLRSTFGSYLEIEAVFGSRMLIAMHGIQLICEHGSHLHLGGGRRSVPVLERRAARGRTVRSHAHGRTSF